MAKKRRLGRGIGSIIGDAATTTAAPPVRVEAPATPPAPGGSDHTTDPTGPSADASTTSQIASAIDRIRQIALEEIIPNKNQPRRAFDEDALASLADSIKAVGVLQPIVVTPRPGGGFELVAGERRWRASRLAGLDRIPAVVREVDERTSAEAALIENVQREDLNPIERSDAIRGLIDRFGLSQSEVASRIGMDRSSVSNLLRLGELEPEIRAMLARGELGLGHGKALLSAPPGPSRVRLATAAAAEGWSVRRMEQEAKSPSPSPTRSSAGEGGGEASPETRDLERRLSEHLGTQVRLRLDRSGRGSIQVRFFDLDHFDDLMSRIGFPLDDRP